MIYEDKPLEWMDMEATEDQILYIEDLLRTSSFSVNRADSIFAHIYALSKYEAAELIEELFASQVSNDPRKQNMERANVMREKL